MAVPFVDLGAAQEPLRAELAEALLRVVDSRRFIAGPEVAAFEQRMSDRLGYERHCVGVSNGSDALLLSMMGLGIGPGDEVIVPSYTFLATASAPSLVGARPVFVDVDIETLNVTPERILGAVNERTRAVIPVHLFGLPADVPGIRAALDAVGRQDIVIIEDAAQALGATWDGAAIGTLSRVACLSFFPTKNLGCLGDGGMITTSDRVLAERFRALRSHGRTAVYHHEWLGMNARLSTLQAASLLVLVEYLDEWLASRFGNAANYRSLFEDHGISDRLVLPFLAAEPALHTYNQFNIRVDPSIRDSLRAHLTDHGIGTAVYYPVPLPYQPCFAYLGHRQGDFPAAEQASKASIALPIYPGLPVDSQALVVSEIATFLGA